MTAPGATGRATEVRRAHTTPEALVTVAAMMQSASAMCQQGGTIEQTGLSFRALLRRALMVTCCLLMSDLALQHPHLQA